MSVRCGNRIHTEPTNHENAAEVRACFQGQLATRPQVPAQRNGAVERLVRAHANNPRTAHVAALVGAGNQWAGDDLMGAREATANQVTYIEGLMAKRDTSGTLKASTRAAMQRVVDGEIISFDEAKAALDELTKLPRKPRQTDADSPYGQQGTPDGTSALVARIHGLKALVPDGRYACNPDGVGQDKLHFYLVQTGKTGHVFVKEYASDSLWPVALPTYEAVLTTIIEDGVEAAGVLFGREYGACRKCGRGLTDQNNPYKEIGYGPDCGAKL